MNSSSCLEAIFVGRNSRERGRERLVKRLTGLTLHSLPSSALLQSGRKRKKQKLINTISTGARRDISEWSAARLSQKAPRTRRPRAPLFESSSHSSRGFSQLSSAQLLNASLKIILTTFVSMNPSGPAIGTGDSSRSRDPRARLRISQARPI